MFSLLRKFRKQAHGFTLAELLISLAILGVIATFTIPKILNAQQDSRNNTIAKEDAATMSQALQIMKYNGTLTGDTTLSEVMRYINYLGVDSTSTIDDIPPGSSLSCAAAGARCLRMHNGSIIRYNFHVKFDTSTGANAIFIWVDPDGTYNQSPSIQFFIYFDGKVRTRGTILNNTEVRNDGVFPFNPDPTMDPPWFSWN